MTLTLRCLPLLVAWISVTSPSPVQATDGRLPLAKFWLLPHATWPLRNTPTRLHSPLLL